MKTEVRKNMLTCLLFFFSWASMAHVPSSVPGDAEFLLRESEVHARAALDAYRTTYAREPDSDEVRWRLSMALHFIGHRFETLPEKKKEYFREGAQFGEESANRKPDCAPCHFWTAINFALYGQTVGAFRMLSLLPKVQKHLHRCREIDPTYAMGGAYRILGFIEQALPGILGGSHAKAIEYFEQAIGAAPAEPLNYLALAKIWGEDLGDKEKAALIAQEGLSALPRKDEPVETLESREELKAFLPNRGMDYLVPSTKISRKILP